MLEGGVRGCGVRRWCVRGYGLRGCVRGRGVRVWCENMSEGCGRDV